jgi:hypothetical protein
VIGILFGGDEVDGDASVFTATFDPSNAGWLVRHGGPLLAEELHSDGS